MQSNTLNKKTADKHGLEGLVTLRTYTIPNNQRAIEIDSILHECTDISEERYKELLNELIALCGLPTREKTLKNRVVIGSRTEIAKRLYGSPAYTGAINYGALGTSSTAVTDVDSQLGTEVKRKLYGTRTQTADQVSFDFYYSKSDTSGTYQEFAAFIDGTAATNSGLMYNRVLTGGWVKTSLEAMTVTCQFNINAA